MKNKRIDYFDFVKGAAICLVILGHCIQFGSGREFLNNGLFFEDLLFRVIYSFHMPLFMLVSGYFFGLTLKKYTLKEISERKLRQLVVPVIAWSGIHYLAMIFMGDLPEPGIFDFVKFTVYQLWFLWAVFYCSMAVAVINRFCRDRAVFYWGGVILTFIVPDILNLQLYKYCYPYFILAYFVGKSFPDIYDRITTRKAAVLLFVSGCSYCLLFPYFHLESYIYTTGYCILSNGVSWKQLWIDIFRFAIGMAGGIAALCLLLVLYRMLKKRLITRLLVSCGRFSAGIYIISDRIVPILKEIPFSTQPDILVYFLELSVILSASFIIVKLLIKIPASDRLLFGGRR